MRVNDKSDYMTIALCVSLKDHTTKQQHLFYLQPSLAGGFVCEEMQLYYLGASSFVNHLSSSISPCWFMRHLSIDGLSVCSVAELASADWTDLLPADER